MTHDGRAFSLRKTSNEKQTPKGRSRRPALQPAFRNCGVVLGFQPALQRVPIVETPADAAEGISACAVAAVGQLQRFVRHHKATAVGKNVCGAFKLFPEAFGLDRKAGRQVVPDSRARGVRIIAIDGSGIKVNAGVRSQKFHGRLLLFFRACALRCEHMLPSLSHNSKTGYCTIILMNLCWFYVYIIR